MPRRPKSIKQSAWDVVDVKYADISSPEWMTTSRLPQKFWTDPHNHRRYIEWLGRELGINQLDDWYRVLVGFFSPIPNIYFSHCF